MNVDVKKSIATLAAVAALTGGVIEGVKPVEPIDTVAPMEIVAERTETATVFDAGGGKRMAVIGTQPVHWKDENGEYKKIDTTVQARALLTAIVSPYEYETAFTAETRALFDKDSDADYAVTKGDYSVAFTFLPDTTGIDIKTETTMRGVKQIYTLRDEKADTRLQWLIETEQKNMQRDGDGFVFTDNEGAFLWQIEPPRAWDADSKPVKVTVTMAGETLTWDVDVSGAKFPVTVDPSTIFNDSSTKTGNIQSGVTLWNNARNAAEWNAPTGAPYVGYNFNISDHVCAIWRSSLLFDTSGLADGATIDSAKVKIQYSSTVNVTNNIYAILVEATFSGTASGFWANDFTGWASSGTYSVVNCSDSINVKSHTSADTLSFKLNAAGLTKISKPDSTIFMMLSKHDIFNNIPAADSTSMFAQFDDDYIYLQVWTVPIPYTPVPTGFTLSSPSTTGMSAAWTNHHTTGIDSLFLVTGAGAWTKHLEKTDETTTITGLTPATQYIYKVAVDSAGTGTGYSLPDTLNTLANAPSSLVLAEVDSTHVSIAFTGGTNPAGTQYAVRDSTTGKWKDATGADTVTKTWRTEAQWEAISLVATKDTRVRIGVVGKNGDGVETAYVWGTIITNNKKTYTFSASTEWHKQAAGAIYTSTRGLTSSAITDAASGELGMSKPSGFVINRAGARFQIPDADSITAATIISTGTGDASTTDYTMHMLLSSWQYGVHTDDDKFFRFAGWQADSTAYNGTNLINAWTTNGNYTGGANANSMTVNASGLAALAAAIHDTLGFQFVSSRDVSSTVPSGNEYVGLTTFRLQLTYWDYDYAPSGVSVSSLAPNQVIVSWTDNAATETGYYVVNAADSTVMGGITNANAVADTITVTPNTIYTFKVLVSGGKVDGEYSSASAAFCTDAGTPSAPVITDLGGGLVKVVIDTTGAGNPSDTDYAALFITSAGDSLWADSDSLNTATLDENSAWGWRTYSLWGAANGDTLTAQPGRSYTIKAVARTREY